MSNRDLSGEVYLHPLVFAAWATVARAAAQAVRKSGLRPEDIPDETIEEHPTKQGWLVVVVRLPGGQEFSMDVAPKDWAWRNAN